MFPCEILATNCFAHEMCPYKKLVKYLVRVRVSAYAFVRDWVRVRVGIRLEV